MRAINTLLSLAEEEQTSPMTQSTNPALNVSSTDVGTTTMPDQRLVAAGGEVDHWPHSKTPQHPTSSSDVGKSTQPDTLTVFIKSMHDDGPTSSKPLPDFNPDDLVGRTFLLPPGDNGARLRAE